MPPFTKKYGWENLFFLVSFCRMFSQKDQLIGHAEDLSRALWIFPLNILIEMTPKIYLNMGYTLLIGMLFLAFFPWRYSGFLGLISWSVWISLLNSFGTISHSNHGYFLVSLGCAIAAAHKSYKRNRSLDLAITSCTYIYTASGLWKLFDLLGSSSIFNTASLNLPEHIAYGLAEEPHLPGQFFLKFFQENPSLSAVSWLVIIFSQIFIPMGIIFIKEWRILFLILLIFFHLGASLTVGASFMGQIYLLVLFIIVTAYGQFFSPEDGSPDSAKLLRL